MRATGKQETGVHSASLYSSESSRLEGIGRWRRRTQDARRQWLWRRWLSNHWNRFSHPHRLLLQKKSRRELQNPDVVALRVSE